MIERTDSDRQPASVDQSWGRIESWLRQRQLESRLGLRPGASEEQIAWFGRHTRQELPAEVKRTWAIHDGQMIGGHGGSATPGVFFGVSLLPLLEPELPNALAIWREQVKRNRESGSSGQGAGWSSIPADTVRAVRWSTAWIPLAVDGRGNLLMTDLEPGANGRSGQVVALRGDDPVRVVLASSWAHFLEDVADELEAGTRLSGREAGGRTTPAAFERGPIAWLKRRLRSTPAAPRSRPASLLELRRSWSEAKFRSRKTRIGPASEGMEGAGPMPVITGPVADECRALVRGYVEAMYDYDRHWLAIRPLRPFGYSELGEQCNDGEYFICGSTGIEDDASGRPEADLVRLMQAETPGFGNHGDDESLTGRQRERVLRVGEFFEEALRMKHEIYEQYWGELPENERIWFHYADPSKYDPFCNQVAEVRLIAQDHVVVLMEPETEAGTPAFLGYHLMEVGGRWLIRKEALHFEDVCKQLVRPARNYDRAARDAANHPTPEAIARARELFAILDEEDRPKPPPGADQDVATWFEKQGAYVEVDDRGVCTVLSLADTGINDADMALVASLTGLQDLTLGPKVTDAGMVHLEGLTELTELSFRDGMKWPKVRGAGLAHLHQMTALTRLDLGYLPIDDSGLAHLRGPINLTEILLYGTRVTDAGLVHLTALPNLEELDLRETNVKGSGLADLAPLKQLKALVLTATRIDDAGLAGLVPLTSLRDLNLNLTRITDAGLAVLAKLTWLESLSLFETDMTPEGLDKLRRSLPDCQIH